MRCLHELPAQRSLMDVFAIVTSICALTNPCPVLSHTHQTTPVPTHRQPNIRPLSFWGDGQLPNTLRRVLHVWGLLLFIAIVLTTKNLPGNRGPKSWGKKAWVGRPMQVPPCPAGGDGHQALLGIVHSSTYSPEPRTTPPPTLRAVRERASQVPKLWVGLRAQLLPTPLTFLVPISPTSQKRSLLPLVALPQFPSV